MNELNFDSFRIERTASNAALFDLLQENKYIKTRSVEPTFFESTTPEEKITKEEKEPYWIDTIDKKILLNKLENLKKGNPKKRYKRKQQISAEGPVKNIQYENKIAQKDEVVLNKLSISDREDSLEDGDQDISNSSSVYQGESTSPRDNLQDVSNSSSVSQEKSTILENKSQNISKGASLSQEKIISTDPPPQFLIGNSQLKCACLKVIQELEKLPLLGKILNLGGHLWGEFVAWLITETIRDRLTEEKIKEKWSNSLVRVWMPLNDTNLQSLGKVVAEAVNLGAKIEWYPSYDFVIYKEELNKYRRHFPLEISKEDNFILPPGGYKISLPFNGTFLNPNNGNLLMPNLIYQKIIFPEEKSPTIVRSYKSSEVKSSIVKPRSNSGFLSKLSFKKKPRISSSAKSSLDVRQRSPSAEKSFQKEPSEGLEKDEWQIDEYFRNIEFKYNRQTLDIYINHGDLIMRHSDFVIDGFDLSRSSFYPRNEELVYQHVYNAVINKDLNLFRKPRTIDELIINLVYGHFHYNQGYRQYSNYNFTRDLYIWLFDKIRNEMKYSIPLMISPSLNSLNLWLTRTELSTDLFTESNSSPQERFIYGPKNHIISLDREFISNHHLFEMWLNLFECSMQPMIETTH